MVLYTTDTVQKLGVLKETVRPAFGQAFQTHKVACDTNDELRQLNLQELTPEEYRVQGELLTSQSYERRDSRVVVKTCFR